MYFPVPHDGGILYQCRGRFGPVQWATVPCQIWPVRFAASLGSKSTTFCDAMYSDSVFFSV